LIYNRFLLIFDSSLLGYEAKIPRTYLSSATLLHNACILSASGFAGSALCAGSIFLPPPHSKSPPAPHLFSLCVCGCVCARANACDIATAFPSSLFPSPHQSHAHLLPRTFRAQRSRSGSWTHTTPSRPPPPRRLCRRAADSDCAMIGGVCRLSEFVYDTRLHSIGNSDTLYTDKTG
jgi:hypothetical protein